MSSLSLDDPTRCDITYSQLFRLRVHPTQEWHDLCQLETIKDLASFFGHYLQDLDNGWKETPKVRLACLRYTEVSKVPFPVLKYKLTNDAAKLAMPYKSFTNWPIPETQYKTLFLNHDKALSPLQPNQPATFTYQSDAPALQMDNDPEELRFERTFDAVTHMIGYSRVILYMSSEQADDFDVFVQLRKVDRNGKLLQNINIPPADLGLREEEVEAINPLKYLGPPGILRASHRDIDRERSKPHWPFYPHTTKKLVSSGEVVRLEIGIWPTAIRFEAGEKLVLKVSGHNMSLAEFPLLRGKAVNCNKGAHNVFVGPEGLSSLTIPIVELE